MNWQLRSDLGKPMTFVKAHGVEVHVSESPSTHGWVVQIDGGNAHTLLAKDMESAKKEAEQWLGMLVTALQDELTKAESKATPHKWEGQPCKTCRHFDTVHAANGGMCFAANCSCDMYRPPGVS